MKNERRIQFLENKQLMYPCIQNMHNYPILGWLLYARILPPPRACARWVIQSVSLIDHWITCSTLRIN